MTSNIRLRFAGVTAQVLPLRQLFFAVATLFFFAGVSSAQPIADLTADFTSVTFPAGWQYLYNTGMVGDSANYAALIWDPTLSGRYDITGAFDPNGPDFTYIRELVLGRVDLHPGRGTVEGVPFNGYTIAAYTIQEGQAGLVSLINGSLYGRDTGGFSNGWDILVFVGNTQVGSFVFPWSPIESPNMFSLALGSLNVGDTVYVALGPNGDASHDAAVLQFQLDLTPSSPTPVPKPASLLGGRLQARPEFLKHAAEPVQ